MSFVIKGANGRNANEIDFSIGVFCGLSPKDMGGPIVKSGPTAGKVRSRNKNGRWHAKRSDAGKPRG